MRNTLLPNGTGMRCASLPLPERLLVRGFRTRVVGLQRRIPVEGVLRQAFGTAGAESAVNLIDI